MGLQIAQAPTAVAGVLSEQPIDPLLKKDKRDKLGSGIPSNGPSALCPEFASIRHFYEAEASEPPLTTQGNDTSDQFVDPQFRI